MNVLTIEKLPLEWDKNFACQECGFGHIKTLLIVKDFRRGIVHTIKESNVSIRKIGNFFTVVVCDLRIWPVS